LVGKQREMENCYLLLCALIPGFESVDILAEQSLKSKSYPLFKGIILTNLYWGKSRRFPLNNPFQSNRYLSGLNQRIQRPCWTVEEQKLGGRILDPLWNRLVVQPKIVVLRIIDIREIKRKLTWI
jgi:hypothetical protein